MKRSIIVLFDRLSKTIWLKAFPEYMLSSCTDTGLTAMIGCRKDKMVWIRDQVPPDLLLVVKKEQGLRE